MLSWSHKLYGQDLLVRLSLVPMSSSTRMRSASHAKIVPKLRYAFRDKFRTNVYVALENVSMCACLPEDEVWTRARKEQLRGLAPSRCTFSIARRLLRDRSEISKSRLCPASPTCEVPFDLFFRRAQLACQRKPTGPDNTSVTALQFGVERRSTRSKDDGKISIAARTCN